MAVFWKRFNKRFEIKDSTKQNIQEIATMKNLLLLGDSIRMGYDSYVQEKLTGRMNVFYPEENCRFSSYIVRNLTEWKKKLACGDDVDLIHWNAGLWDDLIMLDGKHLVDIETYKENVARICDIMKILFPTAKMIFATSTPVQEELFLGEMKRYNRDTERYNAEAVSVVEKYGVEINDLYSVVKGCPKECYSDLTHLYTEQGTKLVADQVIRTIAQTLQIPATPLDYASFFSKKDDVVGI
jgi:hypothetical protein